MSLNARDFTQGGQVLKYMIGMFLQIMNIAVFWILLSSVLVFIGWTFLRMTLEQIIHGSAYWLIKFFVMPSRKLIAGEQVNPYIFNFTRPDGTTYSFKRTASQVMADPYFIGIGEKLKDVAFWGWGLASFTFVGGIIGVTWYLGRRGRLQRQNETLGGRELVTDVSIVNDKLKAEGRLSDFSLSGLHFPAFSEFQNFALHGTVGTGKSTAINEFLLQCRARGDRVIIYDKGCNFVKNFYRQDRDILLNPTDKRCAAWSLWDECQTTADFENFATTLIPDSGHGDPFWLLSARHLFTGTARRMAQQGDRSIANLLKKLLAISLAELREYLKDTDAANLVEGSIEKTAMTIRTVLTSYVRALRYLQGLDEEGKRPFNLRDWIATEDLNGDNSWIFITSDGRNHNALKPLITAWLYLAMVNILGLSASRERHIWLIPDELPSLHKLPILPEFCAEARKFGACTFIPIQNFPQLREIYGKDFADAIWDLLNSRMFFRSPSSTVAEWVAKEIGEKRLLKFKEQYSYGIDIIRDGVGFSHDEVRELLVSYSDVQNLDDLECYVTLKGDYPVVKLKLKRNALREIAEGRIDRNVDEIFDPELEKQLENATSEIDSLTSRVLDKIFAKPGTGAQAEGKRNPPASAEGTPAEDSRTTTLQLVKPQAGPESTVKAPDPAPVDKASEKLDESQIVRHRDTAEFELER